MLKKWLCKAVIALMGVVLVGVLGACDGDKVVELPVTIEEPMEYVPIEPPSLLIPTPNVKDDTKSEFIEYKSFESMPAPYSFSVPTSAQNLNIRYLIGGFGDGGFVTIGEVIHFFGDYQRAFKMVRGDELGRAMEWSFGGGFLRIETSVAICEYVYEEKISWVHIDYAMQSNMLSGEFIHLYFDGINSLSTISDVINIFGTPEPQGIFRRLYNYQLFFNYRLPNVNPSTSRSPLERNVFFGFCGIDNYVTRISFS